MISWTFIHKDGGIYRVNNEHYWPQLPDEETLETMRQLDRLRLECWLATRPPPAFVPERATVGPIFAPPIIEPPPIIRLRKARPKPKPSIRRPSWLRKFSDCRSIREYSMAIVVSDHDYIEAMFWLYSQERHRLLA